MTYDACFQDLTETRDVSPPDIRLKIHVLKLINIFFWLPMKRTSSKEYSVAVSVVKRKL